MDYTDLDKYIYPCIQAKLLAARGYLQLTSLHDMMQHWHQDEDYEGPLKEILMHFNFSNPIELNMACTFWDAALAFKLYDIPEIMAASAKWMGKYLLWNFGSMQSNDAYQNDASRLYNMPMSFWSMHKNHPPTILPLSS